MNALVHIVVVTVLLVTICSLAAVLFLSDLPHADCRPRLESARQFLRVIDEACWMYYARHGEYPPGGGWGSAELVKALCGTAPARPLLDVRPEMLAQHGDLRSPLHPEVDLLHYRNNAVNHPGNRLDAISQNKQTFDLWSRSCDDCETGLNNWDSLTDW